MLVFVKFYEHLLPNQGIGGNRGKSGEIGEIEEIGEIGEIGELQESCDFFAQVNKKRDFSNASGWKTVEF